MEGTALVMWGMVFGAIGLGFFSYGKKQRASVPFVVGVAFFIVPYFIANVYLLVLVGLILMTIPYFLRV